MKTDNIYNENKPLANGAPMKEEVEYVNVNPALKVDYKELEQQKQQEYIKRESTKLLSIIRCAPETSTEIIQSRVNRILHEKDILFFADCSGKYITINQLLDSIDKYIGEKFIDPLTTINLAEHQGVFLDFNKTCLFRFNGSIPIIVGPIDASTKNGIYEFDRIKKLLASKDFRFVRANELSLHHVNWLIYGYIEAGKVALFFGAPASFKSFVVIDMGLSIAAGKDWHGHKVNQGSVLYICGEGQSGINKRIMAWEKLHNQSTDNFFVSSSPVQILSEESRTKIEKEAKRISDIAQDPKLIIIDTLNRNFGDGDENSTADMTKFIKGIDQLSRSLNCAIIIVHHSGLNDANRGRGSSALLGAMDFAYSCKANGLPGNKLITLSPTKTKDHIPSEPKVFEPLDIQIGMDNDGNPISSVALDETSMPATSNKLSKRSSIAFDALKAAIANGDSSEESWKVEAYAQSISQSGTPESNRKSFSRAKKQLLDHGLVDVINGKYVVI